MNKKILAMLMALAMIISMVPMVVGAECSHNGDTLPSPKFDGTHDVYCLRCNTWYITGEACTYVDGECTVCGASQPSQPEHTHEEAIRANKDGVTHTVYCKNCTEILRTENCDLSNGACACGNGSQNTEPECKHEIAYRANEDGVTHTSYCRICGGNTVIHKCTFDANGVCTVCGNGAKEEEKLPEADKCAHPETARTYERNATGGHDFYCNKCKQYVHENCTFVNGKCVCGATNDEYVKPSTPACEHPEADYFYKAIDDTHHKIICLNCGKAVVSSEECVFVNGKCACGNTKAVEPTDPEEPTEPEKPTEPEDPTEPACEHKSCDAAYTAPTCGRDGKTIYTCKDCGKVVKTDVWAATGEHNWEVEYKHDATETEDGWVRYTCSGCNQSYTDIIPATGAAEELPDDTTVDYSAYDAVPKTGSIILEWLYALIFG